MTEQFEVTETRVGLAVVVEVHGDLDAMSAPELRDRLLALIGAGEQHVVVDLQPVEFLDSSGLNALVTGNNEARAANATLALVCTKPGTLKVFAITQLDKVFDIHSSVEAAVAAA